MQFLRQLYLTRFSYPAQNRAIFREVYRLRPASLLEIGVSSLALTQELARLMQEFHPSERPRLGLLDPFDARPREAESLTVREVNAALAQQARLSLFPGDPAQSLPRIANRLGAADVALLSPETDDPAFAPCWYFIPRLLHAASVVIQGRRRGAGIEYEVLSPAEVSSRAEQAIARQRRAA